MALANSLAVAESVAQEKDHMRSATAFVITIVGSVSAQEPINQGWGVSTLVQGTTLSTRAYDISVGGGYVAGAVQSTVGGVHHACGFDSYGVNPIDGLGSAWGEARGHGTLSVVGVYNSHGFIYGAGYGVRMVPDFSWGGIFSGANAVNASEDAVGYFILQDGSTGAWFYDHSVYPEEPYTTYTNEHGHISFNDISDEGLIVGEIAMSDTQREGFVIGPGGAAALGTLGGSDAHASAISGNIIVGESMLVSGYRHAWVLDLYDGDLVDLGTLGGANSSALDVNGAGVVVGRANDVDGNTLACRWIDGVCEPLIGLLPAGHAWDSLDEATAINDHGQIVGQGMLTGIGERAFKFGPLPVNNACADAMGIGVGSHFISTFGAWTDGPYPPSDLCSSTSIRSDVWFRFEPACDGVLDLSICDADFNARLAVYLDDGTCEDLNANIIGCSDVDDACDGTGTAMRADVFYGDTYLIRLGAGGWNHGGTGTLEIDVRPANDDYADRLEIEAGTTDFDTWCATTDGGEHDVCKYDAQTHRDIWYAYTALGTGTVTISTCDAAEFDTDLVVYREPTPPSDMPSDADLIGCNDDYPGCSGYTSLLGFEAQSGETYIFRVGGYGQMDAGFGSLTVSEDFETGCTADLNGNGTVDVGDLLQMLELWGTDDPSGDIDGSGEVDVGDLLALLEQWGSDC